MTAAVVIPDLAQPVKSVIAIGYTIPVSIGYGIKPAVIGIVKIGYKVAVAYRYRGTVAVGLGDRRIVPLSPSLLSITEPSPD